MKFMRRILLNSVFRRNPADLINSHPFFLDMDKLITIKMDKIHCPTKTKERMVRTFLTALFTVYKDKLKNYIENNEIATTTSMRVLMHECWKKYKEVAITEGVPKIFLEKFDEEYKDTFDDMMHALENVTEDNLYDSEYDRFSTILSIMSYCMRTLHMNVKNSISSLNGDLERQLKGSKFDTL